LDVTDKTVITFGERAVGDPQAIRSWFYPGDNFGQEFVYPKRRAVELAKITNLPILAMPTELESEIAKPAKSVNDEPVVALKQAPLTAVKPTGEEVEVDQVVTLPPAQQKVTADARGRIEQLPQTASLLPLWGLIGFLSLGAGLALMVISKRTA
jgi:hypothetical protein